MADKYHQNPSCHLCTLSLQNHPSKIKIFHRLPPLPWFESTPSSPHYPPCPSKSHPVTPLSPPLTCRDKPWREAPGTNWDESNRRGACSPIAHLASSWRTRHLDLRDWHRWRQTAWPLCHAAAFQPGFLSASQQAQTPSSLVWQLLQTKLPADLLFLPYSSWPLCQRRRHHVVKMCVEMLVPHLSPCSAPIPGMFTFIFNTVQHLSISSLWLCHVRTICCTFSSVSLFWNNTHLHFQYMY